MPEHSYLYVFDEHLLAPEPGELVQNFARPLIPDCSSDGVVCPADPALGLELDVGNQIRFGASYQAVVSQLVLHLAE